MKRVIVALGLLAVVVLMSAGALFWQHHATERLIDSCRELMALYEQGDTALCRQKAKELSDNMKQEMRWFPFFLPHDRMESIYREAGALPYLVNDDDPADFFATLASICVQLEILTDSEQPVPENIL